MANRFQWEITLADDSVKKEADGDLFQLSWENDDAVKKLKFVGTGDITDYYEVLFFDGKFYKNGVEIDAGIGNAKRLIFRRRNQIRFDETGSLPLGTTFIAGYQNASANRKIMLLTPLYTPGNPEPTDYSASFDTAL